MTSRAWLRTFLRLGARREHDGVPLADVERQEDTVLATLAHLEREPGLVLADEVGMGKTFEALGVVAAYRHRDPTARICVVTPGPDLNGKWLRSFGQCSDPNGRIFDFGNCAGEAFTLGELVEGAARWPVTLVPVSAFQGARGGGDQAYLLSVFARWAELKGPTSAALFRRYRDGKLERVDPKRERFLDRFELSVIEPHLAEAFRTGDPEEPGLADLYDRDGVDGFGVYEPVRRALDLARFRLVRALLPDFQLLIIDEAHKLKNPESLRNRGVSTVFGRKFRKALFLTATPFQLHIGELRQVFSLFGLATTAPADMALATDGLFADISAYQDAYDRFEQAWRRLDAAETARFTRLYEADPALAGDPADASLELVAEAARSVRDLKRDRIEPGFRRWMIRSLHLEKRQYRQHMARQVEPTGEAILPFLAYERFIAELFRTGDPTHKAAVEVNMVSSFDAAAGGDLFAADRKFRSPTVEAYRRLLQSVLKGDDAGALQDHPKLATVARDALDAAGRGEKTLIFCGRIDTIARLAKDLKAAWEERVVDAWRRVYPALSRDEVFEHAERIRRRFHDPRDLLYTALRERYLQTLVPATAAVHGHEGEVAARATQLLATLRLGASSAERLDYQLAKRVIERAAVERWATGRSLPVGLRPLADILCSDEFLRLGLDRTDDELERREPGDHVPSWSVSEHTVEAVVHDRPHLWQYLRDDLDRIKHDGVLDLELRVQAVERLARYLTRREVMFLPELLLSARTAGMDVDELRSADLIEHVDELWSTPLGDAWVTRLRDFLRYFCRQPRAQRVEILEGPIAQGDFVRNTVDAESREKLREAFNTPLYPMVLIANEVMQEGLDLHHNCRRIVHHDLAWNPAQLEQRVGRIDRIGSLVRRLRESHAWTTLDIHYPLITRTIDERMYRTVKAREKWLEFLLGARPDFNEHEPSAERVPDLPTGLAESLVIDLRPPRAEEGPLVA